MNKFSLVLLAAGTFGLFSCGGGMPEGTNNDAKAETVSQPEEAPETNITLEAGDDMKFNRTNITVPAGQEINITLKHIGKIAKEVMGHNVVILKPDEDVKEYGNAAMKAKNEDFVPKALADKVIAHSKMIGGGETTEFKFKIDTPGKYPFLCSFPGHYPIMKGIIIVK